jgi:hypothetical protein
MQYALLIYLDPSRPDDFTEAETKSMTEEYFAIRDLPGFLEGAGLQPTEAASTVRVADGKALVTDGPFADTKEVLAGFYLFEADNIDPVLEIAAKIPAARIGGSVEVRPVINY